MLRSSLFTASALALVAGASAQTPQQVNAEKVVGAIKHAGIYHVSTGTWTRTGGAVANFGPDVIYSNTIGTGYYTTFGGNGGSAPGSANYDEGGLPGTTNASTVWGGPGPNRDEYNVNGFEIGYCDLDTTPGSGGWELSFYSEYTPCTAATAVADAVIQATALPTGGCWTVVIDLMGGQEFCMRADGGTVAPGWDDDTTLDSFGWSYRYIGTGTAGAGFLLNGDPLYTDPTFLTGGVPLDGTGTYYGAASLCAGMGGTPENGTGYITRDFWYLDDPATTASNCYFFGGYINRNGCGGPQGNPYSSFHMQIWADTATCGPTGSVFGTQYCSSNPNSTGVNTEIQMFGSEIGTNDAVMMTAFNMPSATFGFFITSQTQGFTANPAGSEGNICIAGNIGRFIAPGQIMNSGQNGEISLDTGLGDWSTQAIPVATGQPYAAVAGVTSNFQLWHRDAVAGSATSNFSNAVSVLWL